jgi:4'-phosphopantetheinyl transferase
MTVSPTLANSIDLWFVDPDTACSASLQAAAELLSPDELARANGFRFPVLRRDYLITRWLVRTILSERLSVPGWRLLFGSNAYGRPYLLTHPELSFNISHTNGLIALAVAQAGVVGLDIERLRTDRASPKLADYFAASERAALRSVAPESFDEAFFTYWTLKESYIKALGTGLSTALDSFSLELRNAKSIGFTPSPQNADAYAPHFWLITPRPSHLCAVCLRLCPQALSLNAWNVVPLVSTTALNLTVIRRSTV